MKTTKQATLLITGHTLTVFIDGNDKPVCHGKPLMVRKWILQHRGNLSFNDSQYLTFPWLANQMAGIPPTGVKHYSKASSRTTLDTEIAAMNALNLTDAQCNHVLYHFLGGINPHSQPMEKLAAALKRAVTSATSTK